MEASDPWIVFFFVVAITSFLCSLYVLINVIRIGSFTEFRTYFLLLLHFTLLLQDLSCLPIVNVSSNGLCQFMGWLRFYSGFSNILVIFFFSLHYLCGVSFEQYENQINKFIRNYSLYVIFILPLITLFLLRLS